MVDRQREPAQEDSQAETVLFDCSTNVAICPACCLCSLVMKVILVTHSKVNIFDGCNDLKLLKACISIVTSVRTRISF